MMSQPKCIKIVIVGDGAVGKTCFVTSYSTRSFPEEYVPTVFANCGLTITCDGVQVNLGLFDTAGQEDYDRMRPLSYPETNVFLLCFSIDNWSSFNNVDTKWQLELRHHCPKTPYILVATKSDLRNSVDCNNLVSKIQGLEMAVKIKAARYIECSAKTLEAVDEVVEEAVRSGLIYNASLKNRQLKKCILL